MKFKSILVSLSLVSELMGLSASAYGNTQKQFFEAAKDGAIDQVVSSLDSGLDINLKDEVGFTALNWAVFGGHLGMASFLIARGANPSVRSYSDSTPLHDASRKGSVELVALLLDSGAEIESENSSGMAPLHCAADAGKHEVVQYLLGRGASVNHRDKRGRNALNRSWLSYETAQELIQNHADVRLADNNGLTPLHALFQGRPNLNVIRLLIDSGANLFARDLQNRTPFDLAASIHIKIAVIRMLNDPMNSLLNGVAQSQVWEGTAYSGEIIAAAIKNPLIDPIQFAFQLVMVRQSRERLNHSKLMTILGRSWIHPAYAHNLPPGLDDLSADGVVWDPDEEMS